MAKTIQEMALSYGREHQGTVDIEVFEAGARAAIDEIEIELARSFLNDFNDFSEHDLGIAQGVIGQMRDYLHGWSMLMM